MTEQSSRQEHYSIASRVPEATWLAEGHSKLPTFVMPQIESGSYVPVSDRLAFEADFENMQILAKRKLADEFAQFSSELSRAEPSVLSETLDTLPEQTKSLFTAAVFAAHVASEFFSASRVDRKTRDELGWQPVDPARQDTYQIKKLSESSREGFCVEVSLFMGEILSRLGMDAQYTVGYFQYWPDEVGVYHAFLTAQEGRIVIDPLHLLTTINSPKPEGMLIAAQDTAIFEDTQDAHLYKDIFNRVMKYSASPIPARNPIFQDA